MQRKAIGATFILLLMTQVISAQENSGSTPFRPGLNRTYLKITGSCRSAINVE
jgi:hypothetical protein